MQQSEEENLTKKGKGIKTCHKKYLSQLSIGC